MKDKDDKKKGLGSFAKYSAIGFQMLATIGIFTFAGYKLDAYRSSKPPLFTAILGLAGVLISLYQVVKQLNKNNG